MITFETIVAVWVAIIFALAGINRWAKRRGDHIVLDYDPSKPAIHWEKAELV